MIFALLFGCHHERYTWPRAGRSGIRKRSAAAIPTGHYVTCIECGAELPYDMAEMKVLTPRAQRQYVARLHVAE